LDVVAERVDRWNVELLRQEPAGAGDSAVFAEALLPQGQERLPGSLRVIATEDEVPDRRVKVQGLEQSLEVAARSERCDERDAFSFELWKDRPPCSQRAGQRDIARLEVRELEMR
jgi:hypothetical protein